jgi:translation initiation factor 3 subunit C
LTPDGKERGKDVKEAPEDATISQLAHFLYKNGEDFEKTRALLCHVYYLAHHNRFGEARDLFLMSHVQDSINDADIRTRILFNRTMAQLGLSAFRLGHFDQALDSLMSLYLSARIKELLAQGINQRFNDRDAEKEKLERRRQYPAHMHINLDVLESVHLLSAMFVEVPNTAQNGQDNKRKVISKVFRRFLDYHQGKAFNGPPENTRDCVMAATTKLQRGDWKKALENVQRMKMWKLMPQSDVVFAQVKHKIQEVALRTYLLSYGPYYNSLSLVALCDMFELEEKECYRLCSKMMVSEKLQGAWDQPSKCIYIFAGASNNLQKAALQFSEKAELFLQQNEKLLEQKFGHSFQHQRTWEGGGGNYNNYNNQNAGSGGGGFARRGGFQRTNNYALGSNRGI